MLATTRQLNLSTQQLGTLLTGRTDNDVIDTIPEMVEYIETAASRPSIEESLAPMSSEELDLICL